MFEAPPLVKLQEAIADPENPIGMRMRAAYYLRQAYDNYKRNNDSDDINDMNGSDEINDNKSDDDGTEKKLEEESAKGKETDEIVIETLCKGLEDERHGSLLRHEFAYVMGQIRDPRSCPTLEKTLLSTTDCIMVRHECGEALGAISSPSSIPHLQTAIKLNPQTPEISQTCSLSLSFMEWKQNGGVENDVDNDGNEQPPVCACMLNPYSSVDPAPPHPSHVNLSTKDIGLILHNESKPLFERYRAMFSLRNRGTKECVEELGHVLIHDTSSALLRHEIAYVLGQLQSKFSIEVLKCSLERKEEHVMVRHESAEALGAIEEDWEKVEGVLRLFLEDEDEVVRESCVVALDAADYWGRLKEEGDEVDHYGEEGNCGVDDENEDRMNRNEDAISNANNSGAKLSFAQQKALPVI